MHYAKRPSGERNLPVEILTRPVDRIDLCAKLPSRLEFSETFFSGIHYKVAGGVGTHLAV
jgi:hypothetical protein